MPARSVPGDDRPPHRQGLLQSALALKQEGAAIEGADVLPVDLYGASPVGQRALGIAQTGASLAAQGEQPGVVRRQPQPRFGDGERLLVGMRPQIGAGEEAVSTWLIRRGRQPLLVE